MIWVGHEHTLSGVHADISSGVQEKAQQKEFSRDSPDHGHIWGRLSLNKEIKPPFHVAT